MGLGVPLLVKALVVEEVLPQALKGEDLHEAGGEDPVRVNVLALKGTAFPRITVNFSSMAFPPQRTPARPKTSRASAISPATAAAATMRGLMRTVRPLGLPMRPL